MKVGDLVILKNGVHLDGIPKHRTAIIVSGRNSTGDYELMFVGSDETHTFNEYFISLIQKVN